MRTLGPYTSGEIPEPLVVTFTDGDGNAIDLTGYEAKFVLKVNGDDADTVDATITDADGGEVTYVWVEGDLATAGVVRAEMWVGNGTNRFASERFAMNVRAALAVPEI